jgi:hypothetical protein
MTDTNVALCYYHLPTSLAYYGLIFGYQGIHDNVHHLESPSSIESAAHDLIPPRSPFDFIVIAFCICIS